MCSADSLFVFICMFTTVLRFAFSFLCYWVLLDIYDKVRLLLSMQLAYLLLLCVKKINNLYSNV